MSEKKNGKFAAPFYTSTAWARCRAAYKKSVGGLCERCLAKGLIVPGEQVHHKIRLTPQNMNDPSIALSFDNLELLCSECHHAEHQHEQRWRTNPDGTVEL